MKATIVITDEPNDLATMTLHFDPPLQRGAPKTACVRIVESILNLRGTVLKPKETEWHSGNKTVIQHHDQDEPTPRHD